MNSTVNNTVSKPRRSVNLGCCALWLAVATACSGGGGGAASSPPPPVSPHSLDFFDATKVNPQAGGFQLADYDSTGRRVIFYPWGGIVTKPRGTVLAYHTDHDFLSAASYKAVDLTALVSPDAQGFGTGFVDDTSTWSYFVPFRTDRGAGQEANDLAIRFNLKKELSDPGAYETFRIASLPSKPRHLGWITGAYANGHAYYTPYGTPIAKDPWHLTHGILLRYEASKPFTDPSAWQWHDLTQVHAKAKGFQSVAVKWPWLYLIPYYPGNNILVRYNTERPFTESASYETVDLASLNPGAIGYTGAIMAGDHLVFVPWRKDVSLVNLSQQSASLAAAFDTRKPLSDSSAWSFFDLTRLHPEAKGYQFGWLDKKGLVHFVPSHNFGTSKPPPFVAWDSAQSFADPSSWTVYPGTAVTASTGAAYDGVHAWLAPYGSGLLGANGTGESGLITRVSQ